VSRADAVIANSEAGLAAYGVAGSTAFVIHNGFDAERVQQERHGSVGAEHRRTEVVMVARMVRWKDFDTLLGAAEALSREGRSIRFTFLGSGPDRERLNARCRERVSADLVRIADCGLEVMPTLAAADIGVLLTDPRYHAEGLSNSIMEYMACGLPVVCTDSGGNREIVVDGRTGLLVPPRDPAAVVDALRILLCKPETARRLGDAGRERIREEFSTRKMVEATISVYESVIRRASELVV